MTFTQIPSSVTTAFQVLDPDNLDATPFFRADETGVYSNGTPISTAGGNVFGPATPTTNGLPVWQDPLTPGSLGDTLVNSPVIIDHITGNASGFGTITSGANGTAGELIVYSPGLNLGNILILPSNNSGNYGVTITNAAYGQSSTLTLPDAGGANSSFILSETAAGQSISSNITIDGAAQIDTLASQTLTMGANGSPGEIIIYPNTVANGVTNITMTGNPGGQNTNIIVGAMGQGTTVTVPDPGNATANFVLTKGAQTISGPLTLTQTLNGVNYVAGSSGTAGAVTLYPSTAASGTLVLSATNNGGNFVTTITNAAQAAARTYSIIDAGGNANFVMSQGIQTINGALTLSANLDASTIVSGSSGSAGGISIFPATVASGNILYSAANNGGNFLITVTNASFGQATVLTYPDPGSTTAKFVFAKTSGAFPLTAGAATVVDANITAGGAIFLALQTPGGTIAGTPYVDTITPGVGFTVTGGGAGNSSTIAYYSLVGF